ncbi:MAG: hypothetical protein K6D02_04915, partial [Lachnospiraceae bacterium]|nr:hypothetical protein [Lachnospiraceae bacterium]
LFDGCNSITDFTFPVLIQSMARYALPSTIKNVYFYGTEDEFETLIDSSNQSDYGYLLEDSVNKEYNYTSDVDYDYHNYEKGETVAPTCMEEGYTTYICSGCGKEKHEDIKPALGHDYVATIHAPTCTEVGYTIHTCKNCNHTYTDSLVEALGHKYKEIVTPATTTADGAIETKCEGCNDVKESKAIPMIGSFALGETTYIYDGKAKTPTVKPVDKNGTEIATDYYNITYSGNTNPGTGKVTITYKGNYSGTTSLDFTINPKGTSLKKLTAKKKKLTVKWKKNSVQTTGYQIQCSTASNFKKNKKTVTIKKNKTVKTVIKKLKKKKYFVRIRTYKTVDGKKYFSKWSKVKKIKVK